jgi:hypothetical protein
LATRLMSREWHTVETRQGLPNSLQTIYH